MIVEEEDEATSEQKTLDQLDEELYVLTKKKLFYSFLILKF